MDLKKLCSKFCDETCRIEEIILLAGILADYSLPDPARNFFENEEIETIEECFGKLPDYVKEATEEEDIEVITEWLSDSGKYGFLMKIATPIMKPTGPKSATYSWGYYTAKWIYADTLDAVMNKGFAWVRKRREKERK